MNRIVACAALLSLALAAPARADEADTHYNICRALKKDSKTDEAIAACRKCLEARKTHPWCHFTLGTLLRATDLPAATKAFEAARDLLPKRGDFHASLGAAYLRAERYDDAMKSLETAITLGVTEPEPFMNLVKVYHQKGFPERALVVASRAVKGAPRNAIAINNYCVALRLNKKIDEAITECKKAVALEPKNPICRFNLGVAYRVKGNIDAAIEQYLEAVKADDRHADAWHDLGMMWAQKRENEKAVDAFRKHLALSPRLKAKERKEVEEWIKQLGGAVDATPTRPAKGKKR
ncbi:MAG TPA: tetratricopeptide repeat protein [Polyangia bacterium]